GSVPLDVYQWLEDMPANDLVRWTAQMLRDMITPYHLSSRQLNEFGPEPATSLAEYVKHLLTMGDVPRVCLPYAVILILDLLRTVPGAFLCRANVYRVFLIALITGSKMLEDSVFAISSWAVISFHHYKPETLAFLELEFLGSLEYSVRVSRHRMDTFLRTVMPTRQDPSYPRPKSSWRDDFAQVDPAIQEQVPEYPYTPTVVSRETF
ncbi:hypothetical protein KIPB_008876, partial [Kipferlia bialata]